LSTGELACGTERRGSLPRVRERDDERDAEGHVVGRSGHGLAQLARRTIGSTAPRLHARAEGARLGEGPPAFGREASRGLARRRERRAQLSGLERQARREHGDARVVGRGLLRLRERHARAREVTGLEERAAPAEERATELWSRIEDPTERRLGFARVALREQLLGALHRAPHVLGEQGVVEEAAEAIEEAHAITRVVQIMR
jgi:hypothetical protein